jgi:hypothetical protein
MGYGDDGSMSTKRTWSQVIFPEHGTYAEFRKLQRAEAEKAKAEKTAGESLLVVQRGTYPAFDQFVELLEGGARIAAQQRKWLIGIPVTLCFICGSVFGFAGYTIFSAGLKGDGMPPAEVVQTHTFDVQLSIVMLCLSLVTLLASLSPTSIKGIYYTCIGLILYFVVCGSILCPFAMPLILPDSTGTVYKLWMACGIIKCWGFILTLIWAICTQAPRKCLAISAALLAPRSSPHAPRPTLLAPRSCWIAVFTSPL